MPETQATPVKKLQFKVPALFIPNQPNNNTLQTMLMIFWIGVGLMMWITAGAHYLPTPLEVLQAFPKLWNNLGIGFHLWSSLSLNLESIGIMFAITYVMAVLSRTQAFEPVATLMSIGRFNGFVGLPMVFMSILHDHHSTKVALLVFGMGVFTVMSLTKLFDSVPKDYFDHARTLRMSEWRVIWEVVVLGTFDKVIDVLRINVAMGWMMLPMVEGRFKEEGGVGALLEIENKHLNLDVVFAIIVWIMAFGFLQDWILGLLKRIACPYSILGMEKK